MSDNNNSDKQSASSSGDEAQVQNVLASYREIAHNLRASADTTTIEEALSPITSLAESQQFAVLKALAKERSVEAADIAQALHTMGPAKEVRKEARRALIRLESGKVYAEWTPPPAPRLSDALGLFNPSAPTSSSSSDLEDYDEDYDDGDDEDDSDTFGDDTNAAPSFMSEFEALLRGSGLFEQDEQVDVAKDFLEEWVEGNFEDAQELLALSSPLRAGFSPEDWTAHRQQWTEQAHPRNLRVIFASLVEDEEEEDTNTPQAGSTVDIGWSIEIDELPQDLTLPEVPTSLRSFSLTGRHWFWSRFTLIEEDDELLIENVSDYGAELLRLSSDEVNVRLDHIKSLIDKQASDLQDESAEEEEEENEVKPSSITLLDTLKQNDLEEEDDDDDSDDELNDLFGEIGVAMRLLSKSTYYCDVTLAHVTDRETITEACQSAAAYSSNTQDFERAASYCQQLLEVAPERRGQTLRELGTCYYSLAQYHAMESNETEELRFAALAEKTLREALAESPEPASYLALSKVLFAESEHMEEARTLLEQASKLNPSSEELVDIEAGLAHIAEGLEEPEQALVHYQRVADLDPEYPNIHFNLGSLQSELGHFDEAITNLQNYLEESSDASQMALFEADQTKQREEASRLLAHSYIGKGNLARARQVLQDALEWNAESPTLLAQLALVYIAENDLRSAQKYLLRAEQVVEDEEDAEFVQEVRDLYDSRKNQPRLKFSSKQQKPKKKR